MIINYLNNLDQHISLFINAHYNGFTDAFMPFMSNKLIWLPMYLLIIILLYYRLGWKRASLALVFIFLTVGCCDQTANLFKNGIGRLRPCYNEYMIDHGLRILESRTNFFGFFSGHSSNSFCLATVLSLIFSVDSKHRYRLFYWFIYIWAFLVSISRVFVGKHFFGDILVGAIIGTVIALFFGSLYKICCKKIT